MPVFVLDFWFTVLCMDVRQSISLQREALGLSQIRLARRANVSGFKISAPRPGDGSGGHLQALLDRALTLAKSPDCDARVRYHLARAAELIAGEDGGAVQTLAGGAN